jgi:hypothetical protein
MTFNQATDAEGQVTGLPRGGKIQMRVKALNDGNTNLLRWMIDKKLALGGRIVFTNTTSGVLMKTIEFRDAYCVNYTEYWEDTVSNTALAHWEEITISCREIRNLIDGLKFANTWTLVK